MTRETKKTAYTGVALFLAGVISFFLNINDDGLFAYILMAYGAWEIGEAVSDYIFSNQKEEIGNRSWEDVKREFKADTAQITIPMVLTMLVEVIMIGTGFRFYTFFAYILTLIIYLIFIALFSYYEINKIEEEGYSFEN